MLLSGPRSYFNDYARKNGLGRALNDPPTLLTDRGAYVNFLEIQLERVSASCLSIQSYDQKFNDVHEMIVGLEQRCGNTSKLVNIAQQCTLELRNENDAKLQAVANNVKGEHYEMQKLLEAMSTRISAAEQVLTTLPSLVARMDTIESRIARNELDFELYQKNMTEKSKSDEEEFSSLKNANVAFKEAAEKLRSEVSKNSFEIQENEARSKIYFTNMEENFQEELKNDRDEASRKVEVLTANLSFQVEKLQADSVSRESGCLSALRLFKEANTENINLIKDELNSRCGNIEADFTSKYSDIRTSMEQSLASLSERLVMTGNRISVLSAEYTEHKNKTTETISGLEMDVDDVYNSIDEMVEGIEEVTATANKAVAASSEQASDINILQEDIALLDRILGQVDESIEARLHYVNEKLQKGTAATAAVSDTGVGVAYPRAGAHSMHQRRDEIPSVSSPSESESNGEERGRRGESSYSGTSSAAAVQAREKGKPFPPGQRVDSEGRVILDYLGAGLYSGLPPNKVGKGKNHIHKMVTSPSDKDKKLLKRSVSFDPVMRSGTPPAKKEKLGYIGSGIYWDRSQPFDKHLVIEMLEDMKDSDSICSIERAELLYAAQNNAESPPLAVKNRIRDFQLKKELQRRDGREESLAARLIPRGDSAASARSETSARSSTSRNSKRSDASSQAKLSERSSSADKSRAHERHRTDVFVADATSSATVSSRDTRSSQQQDLPPRASSAQHRRASMSDISRAHYTESAKKSGAVPKHLSTENNASTRDEERSKQAKTEQNEVKSRSGYSKIVDDVSSSSSYSDDRLKKPSISSDGFEAALKSSGTSMKLQRSADDAILSATSRKRQDPAENPASRRSLDSLAAHRASSSMSQKKRNNAEETRQIHKEKAEERVDDSLGSFSMSADSSAEIREATSMSSRQYERQSVSVNSHDERQSDVMSNTIDRSASGFSTTTLGSKNSLSENYLSSSSETTRGTLDSIQDRVKKALRRNYHLRETTSSVPESGEESTSTYNMLVESAYEDDEDDEDYVYNSESSTSGSDSESDDEEEEQESSEMDTESRDDGDEDLYYGNTDIVTQEADDEQTNQSRSLMDMSEYSTDLQASPRTKKSTVGNRASDKQSAASTKKAAKQKQTASGRVRHVRRSVSPHLIVKPDYFYYDDILALEAKEASTSPHERIPEIPWVPNSSTRQLRRAGYAPAVDDSVLGLRRAREMRTMEQTQRSCSRSTEALLDVPLFTAAPTYKGVCNAFKGRRHFETLGPAGSQPKGSGVHLS